METSPQRSAGSRTAISIAAGSQRDQIAAAIIRLLARFPSAGNRGGDGEIGRHQCR